MAMIAHAMPGGVYVFQGEELGLLDADIPNDARQDPIWFRTNGADPGRDGSRAPLPWVAHAKNYGFSEADKLWLPQPSGWDNVSADVEDAEPTSFLNLYRAMLRNRAEVNQLASETDFEWLGTDGDVVGFRRREELWVLANISDSPAVIAAYLPPNGRVVALVGEFHAGILGANSALWIRK